MTDSSERETNSPEPYNSTETRFVVPVIEEELSVEKRIVTTGRVRVRKLVHEVEEIVKETLASSRVDIQRVSKDLSVEGPLPVRVEGDITIVPIVEEVLVVTKQWHLKEEIHISRRHSSTDYTERVTVRSEEAVVERVDP